MKKRWMFLVLIFIISFFILSCAPKQETGITTESPETKPQERDDFGCWPPSCSFMPAGMARQMCEDWKAGKTINWFDCSFFSQYPDCKKLCEFEMKSSNQTATMPSFPTSPTGENYPRPPTGENYPSSPTGQNYPQPTMPTLPAGENYPSPPTGKNYPQPPIGYSQDGQNYGQNDQQYQADIGIPKEDSGAENVYIYFTDYKHSRIIRMDDMTGKNLITFGSIGTGIGQFTTPEKLFVQPDGHIYIADPNGGRIVRIDDMTGKGWLSYGSGGRGSYVARGIGQFNQPHAVRLDAQGRIYIAEGNCRIVRIDDMTGKGWTEYGTGKQCGQSETTIGNPFDVAFDSQSRIYTVDGTDTPRIIRIDDMTGKGFVTYGTKGNGVGQFVEPQSIAIDTQGRIYVTDEDKETQGGRIIRIDDMTGKGWVTFPPVSPDARIKLPHDITIRASGKIYIANTADNSIVRMDDMTGKGYISYAPCANCPSGTDPNQLEAPKGIFIVERK